MKRIRYMMPARSQGKLHMQRTLTELVEKDEHPPVSVYDIDPDVETLVRKWFYTRLDDFYCDLQVMYIPHFTSPTRARTHIVLNNTPPLHAMVENVEATGLNPHMAVCGWPVCLCELERNGEETV